MPRRQQCPVLRLGSVCSGLGTDREALRDIQAVNRHLQIDQVFAADSCPKSRKVILHNHEVQQFFGRVLG